MFMVMTFNYLQSLFKPSGSVQVSLMGRNTSWNPFLLYLHPLDFKIRVLSVP